MKETCPRCGSSEIKLEGSAYPRAFECRRCGFAFVTAPQALTDE